jgi:hypothetical protein
MQHSSAIRHIMSVFQLIESKNSKFGSLKALTCILLFILQCYNIARNLSGSVPAPTVTRFSVTSTFPRGLRLVDEQVVRICLSLAVCRNILVSYRFAEVCMRVSGFGLYFGKGDPIAHLSALGPVLDDGSELHEPGIYSGVTGQQLCVYGPQNIVHRHLNLQPINPNSSS